MTPTSSTETRTAWQDLSSAFKALTVALLLIGSGLPAVIGKFANQEEWADILGILSVTLPFTLWVAITILIAVTSSWMAYSQAIFATISLTVLTLLGSLVGIGLGADATLGTAWDHSHGQVNQFLGHLISTYALAYGAGTFFSAIAIGAFLGYCGWRLFVRTPPR